VAAVSRAFAALGVDFAACKAPYEQRAKRAERIESGAESQRRSEDHPLTYVCSSSEIKKIASLILATAGISLACSDGSFHAASNVS
jgi:hypothetical protein